MALVGAGAAVVFLAIAIVLTFLNPDIDPLHDPLSNLALGRAGLWMDVAFVLAGLTVAGMAWALRHDTLSRPLAFWGEAFLVAGGAQVVLLGIFPTDPTAEPVTWTGWLHRGLAGTGFGCIVVAVAMFSRIIARDVHARRVASWSRGAAGLVVLMFAWNAVIFVVTTYRADIDWYGGLSERLLVGSVLAWAILTCVWAMRVARVPAHLLVDDGKWVVRQ
ncbi:MAG: DUF998 domain-containing protein [Thermoplasmatota archaeon]